MPGTTPIYGLPYQSLDDPPHGPNLGQNLAEAVETELARIDATPKPTQINDFTSIASFSNTTPAAGTPAAGFSFTAPPSGKVYLTVTGQIECAVNGNTALLGYEVRTGGTVGSGTVVLGASFNRAVETSKAVNAGAAARITASNRFLATGLTPGATYNVQTMHWMSPAGTGTVSFRQILMEPVL